MDKEMTAYCGLYCGHCYSRTHVAPTAKELKEYMVRQGFEDFGPYMENYKEFWQFLNTLIDAEGCPGCAQGGGNPGCEIRACARERKLAACPQCEDYPCDKFGWLASTENYPMLADDNRYMKEYGLAAWRGMQEKRRADGFTYVGEKMKRREGDAK